MCSSYNFAKEHKDIFHLKSGQKTACLDPLLAIQRCHYHILEVMFHSGSLFDNCHCVLVH